MGECVGGWGWGGEWREALTVTRPPLETGKSAGAAFFVHRDSDGPKERGGRSTCTPTPHLGAE